MAYNPLAAQIPKASKTFRSIPTVSRLTDLAESGNEKAMFALYLHYTTGKDVPKDSTIALQWLERAAKAGHSMAIYRVGLLSHHNQMPGQDSMAFLWLLTAAQLGNVYGMQNTGIAYLKGDGIKKDTLKAIKWLTEAANAGNIAAMQNLATLALRNLGGLDSTHMHNWTLKAAKAGDSNAMLSIGNRYMSGTKITRDTVEGMKWILKSAKSNNTTAMEVLAWRYDRGNGLKKDSAESLRWYLKAADAGNASAQNTLGLKYSMGRWVKRDYAKAIEFFTKSANAGNGYGMYNLGLMYEFGRGVKQDYALAMEWYLNASKVKSPDATTSRIGRLYEYGKGVPQNDEKAMGWYIKNAAKDGNSMYLIGNLFEQGKGVEANLSLAITWYEKAATANNGYGMLHLARAYEKNKQVDKASTWYNRAFEWFKLDTEKSLDNAESMRGLAMMYEDGKGTTADKALAFYYYSKAADLGDDMAKKKLSNWK